MTIPAYFYIARCPSSIPRTRRGLALTTTRRKTAEVGRTHVTARKLGALFDVIPRTSRLVKAYGKRVSETAKSPLPIHELLQAVGILRITLVMRGIQYGVLQPQVTVPSLFIC